MCVRKCHYGKSNSKKCQYGVVDNQPVCCTSFALKMASVEDQNLCRMFLTSCLAVVFGLK